MENFMTDARKAIAHSNSLADLAARIRAEHSAASAAPVQAGALWGFRGFLYATLPYFVTLSPLPFPARLEEGKPPKTPKPSSPVTAEASVSRHSRREPQVTQIVASGPDQPCEHMRTRSPYIPHARARVCCRKSVRICPQPPSRHVQGGPPGGRREGVPDD